MKRRPGGDAAGRSAAVLAWVYDLAMATTGGYADDDADDDELRAVEQTVRLHARSGAPLVGQTALWTVGHLIARGRLTAATDLATTAHRILAAAAGRYPDDADRQWDLSVANNKLADVFARRGDLAAADRHFADGLAIARRLADADPADAGKQLDVFVPHANLGDVAARRGDVAAADRHYADALAIRRRPGRAGRCLPRTRLIQLPGPWDDNGCTRSDWWPG